MRPAHLCGDMPDDLPGPAPAVMVQPEEIADAVIQVVRDTALAGRVMLYYEGQARRLVPIEDEV